MSKYKSQLLVHEAENEDWFFLHDIIHTNLTILDETIRPKSYRLTLPCSLSLSLYE